ncbi:MAG: hypothetical protein Q4B86_03305 [Eubacteriales bacterium]|nr:hypothetical protein [Eubacteriales bacterium]
MTVIKDEFKSKEITRYDILPLSFLKKSSYTGSKGAFSYKFEKTEIDEGEEAEATKKTVLRVYFWKGYYAFSETASELIRHEDFSFDDKGIDEAIAYLNARLKEL